MARGRGATATLIKPRKRARPRPQRRAALDREARDLHRVLATFDQLMELAAEENRPEQVAKLEEIAWSDVRRVRPIRLFHASQLLGVSDRTVSEWSGQGILKLQAERPKRVSLEEVLRAKEILDELRELGRDRDFMSAVLNRLEVEELMENDRFLKSLEQMQRGERGEWPEGY